ncbi:hypothetical protein BRAO375_860043 [Bradyrhizobium sp. ORS 375]|nr:hypothetical protein BRAO375_860043 [Bradyrhizobium sp. ORS 375]
MSGGVFALFLKLLHGAFCLPPGNFCRHSIKHHTFIEEIEPLVGMTEFIPKDDASRRKRSHNTY